MSEHETVADIIAEMRDWLGDANSYDLRSLADRLEAAIKSERGDAAKLREALEAAHRTLKLVYENAVEFIQPRLADEIIHTGSAVEAALAAPPRNCNRFGTFAQAKAEWWKTEVLPRVEGVVGGEEPPFDEWLFLPATEQKGENNANK